MAEENNKEIKKEEKKEEKKIEKRPTALKRIMQSRRKNQFNRQQKEKIKTAFKGFTESFEKKENKEVLLTKLNLIFSLLDKAVKSNIFKKNKANRLKAKYSLMYNK